MERHLWILQIYSPTLMPFLNQNQWGISSYPHISLVKFAIAFVSGNWSWCWVLETGTACDDTSLFIKSPTNTASSAHLSLWSASNSPSVPIRSEYCISVAPIQFLQAISQMSIYIWYTAMHLPPPKGKHLTLVVFFQSWISCCLDHFSLCFYSNAAW